MAQKATSCNDHYLAKGHFPAGDARRSTGSATARAVSRKSGIKVVTTPLSCGAFAATREASRQSTRHRSSLRSHHCVGIGIPVRALIGLEFTKALRIICRGRRSWYRRSDEYERHDGPSLRHALMIDEAKSGIGSGQKKSLRHT
jgi:hypothetical protein